LHLDQNLSYLVDRIEKLPRVENECDKRVTSAKVASTIAIATAEIANRINKRL